MAHELKPVKFSGTFYLGMIVFSCFLVLPYHQLLENLYTSILYYTIAGGSALLWFRLAGNHIQKPIFNHEAQATSKLPIIILVLFWPLVTFPFLFDSLALYGDENYHVMRSVMFRNDFIHMSIGLRALLYSFPVGLAVLCSLHNTRRIHHRWIFLAFFIYIATTAWCLRDAFPTFVEWLVRYPALFAILETSVTGLSPSFIVDEWAHRLNALLPMLVLSLTLFFIFARHLSVQPFFILCIILGVFSLPILRYHATLVYIDPLVFALICTMLVSLRLDSGISSTSLWKYGPPLSLLGAIKITALPLLLTFTLCSILFFLKEGTKPDKRKIACFSLLMIIPSLPQLLLRILLKIQNIPVSYDNFFSQTCWTGYIEGLLYQFGPLFLMVSLCGLLMIIFKERGFWSHFILIYFSLYLFFMFRVEREFVGISRYQLYLAPCFILGFFEIIKIGFHFSKNKHPIVFSGLTGFLILLTAVNLAFPLRGHPTKPNWASPLSKHPESFYPFNDAALYVKEQEYTRIFISGTLTTTYNYLFFYEVKHGFWEKQISRSYKPKNIESALLLAKKSECEVLIYAYATPPTNSPIRGAKRFSTYGNFMDVVGL